MSTQGTKGERGEVGDPGLNGTDGRAGIPGMEVYCTYMHLFLSNILQGVELSS